MAEGDADSQQLKLNSGGGKKKLIIMIGAVVLLAVIGVVVFMMMGSSEGGATSGGMSEEEKLKLEEAKKIYYISIPTPIIFKVAAKPKGHLVQLRLALLVRGEENKKLAEHHMPSILSAITTELYDTQFVTLQTAEGKASLKDKAIRGVHAKMKQLENKTVVEKILYEGFIVQ